MGMSTTTEIVHSVYRHVDGGNMHNVAAHLAKDCTFTLANEAPVKGREEIERHLAAFIALFDETKHEVSGIWQDGDVIITRLSVTYKRKDGLIKTYPAAVFWQMKDRLIVDFSVFIDVSTIFS
jgi:ketosteroid isomerase-like protein